MGRRKIRAASRADCRTGRPEPRRDGDRRHPRHSRGKKSSDLGAAGHGRYRRSRRHRCGAEPCATRRQHYGAQRDGDRPRRQAAATTRGSCYWPVARCGSVESAKRVSGNFYQGVERRRRNLEIKVQPVAVGVAEDLDAAFATLVKDKPQALIILADRIFLHNRAPLIDFATQNRLPGVYAYRELVEAGGLMSYGPSYEDLHRRAATYVDKILKGAKPAELPIEQPTKFNLVISRRAAEALGLTIPGSILALADVVIE